MDINMIYKRKIVLFIMLSIILPYIAPAQKGLHAGFSAGIDFTINKMDKNYPTPPLIRFFNRTSAAESFYL